MGTAQARQNVVFNMSEPHEETIRVYAGYCKYILLHIFVFAKYFFYASGTIPKVLCCHLNLSDIGHRFYFEHDKIAIVPTVCDKMANDDET